MVARSETHARSPQPRGDRPLHVVSEGAGAVVQGGVGSEPTAAPAAQTPLARPPTQPKDGVIAVPLGLQ